MYEKYTTEAFVVGQKNLKESDKIFLFFTEDFGLIWVIATGIRKHLSKLKPYLEVGNKLTVTLIKGREFWRVVEVERDTSNFLDYKLSRITFLHILKTVQKMVQGEEKNLKLWQALCIGFERLKTLDEKYTHSLECIVFIRILDALGYGSSEKVWRDLLSADITYELLEKAYQNRKIVIGLINESLKQSQLNH